MSMSLGAGKTTDTRMIIDRRQKLIYVVVPQQQMILVNHALERAGGQSLGHPTTTNSCRELMGLINPIALGQQLACKPLGYETIAGRSTDKC